MRETPAKSISTPKIDHRLEQEQGRKDPRLARTL